MITNIDILENLILKQKVAYHKHESWVEHPVAVKYHQDYFTIINDIKNYIFQNKELAEVLNVLSEYGNPVLVGGGVRDSLLGIPPKDFDIEMYGIPSSQLGKILKEKFGAKEEQVGQQFGVFKVKGFDISLPRSETKIGEKHTDFDIREDPFMNPMDAARRRDFTINALLFDVKKGQLLDFFGGIDDLRNKIIRHIDDKTFVEDALRVYRAAQFAARFGFGIHQNTIKLASKIDLSNLPSERIYEEWQKLLLRADKPSIGLDALDNMKVLEKYYPELYIMKNTPQRDDYHAEGNVYNHTKLVIDKAAQIIKEFPDIQDKKIIMLASLLHDIGKPLTTKYNDAGQPVQPGHDDAGIEPAEKFLNKLTNETDITENVLFIVENHLLPAVFYRDKVQDASFRRLINKYGLKKIQLLLAVSQADMEGRIHKFPDGKTVISPDSSEALDWFNEKLNNVVTQFGITEQGKMISLITGDDVLGLGFKEGKQVGVILQDVKKQQENGNLKTREDALRYVQEKYLQKSLDFEKDEGFVHQHENWPEHPIRVKYHTDYFTHVKGGEYELPKPRQKKTPSGLNIPPSWTDVFVATRSGNPLQAFGYDMKGTKHYLYSKIASKRNAAKKFNRLNAFSKVLPVILNKISKDVSKSEEAQILYIISKTGFRIGSDTDTGAKVKAYGASTLLGEHVAIDGEKVTFKFVGKKGVINTKIIEDPIMALFLTKKKLKLGQKIFNVSDNDVRNYMKVLTNKPFLIKDFRTYIGTSMAYDVIKTMPIPESAGEWERGRKTVAIKVSEILGNTPGVALSAYIAPEAFSSWVGHLEQKGIQIKKEYETFTDFLETIHYGDEDLSDYDIDEENDYDDEELEDESEEYIEKQFIPKNFNPIKDILSRFKHRNSGKLAVHTHEGGAPSGHPDGNSIFPPHPVSVKYHQRYFEEQKQPKEKGERGDLFKPNQFEIERRFTLYKQLISDEQSREIFNSRKELQAIFLKGPPASHLLKVKEIKLINSEFLEAIGEVVDPVGSFDMDNNTIEISNLGDEVTLAHEVGHAIMDSQQGRTFPLELLNELLEIYNYCLETNSGFPNDYSKTNENEFFAECYATFLMNNKHFLKRNNLMYDFFYKVFDFFKDQDDVFLQTGIIKSKVNGKYIDPENVGKFDFELPDLVLEENTEEKIEKDKGFVHQHENWPKHPIGVKYHEDYFREQRGKQIDEGIKNFEEEQKVKKLRYDKVGRQKIPVNWLSEKVTDFVQLLTDGWLSELDKTIIKEKIYDLTFYDFARYYPKDGADEILKKYEKVLYASFIYEGAYYDVYFTDDEKIWLRKVQNNVRPQDSGIYDLGIPSNEDYLKDHKAEEQRYIDNNVLNPPTEYERTRRKIGILSKILDKNILDFYRGKYQNIIDFVPSDHIHKVSRLVFNSEDEKTKIIGYYKNDAVVGHYIGFYYHDDAHIELYKKADYYALIHEIGHAVQYSKIGRYFLRDFQSRIENLYSEAITSNSGFPSEYSRENSGEFFAESYAAFATEREGFKERNPKMWELVKEIWEYMNGQDDNYINFGILKSENNGKELKEDENYISDPEGVGHFNPNLPNLKEKNEESIEKDKGFVHTDEGKYPLHPISVKYHEDYFRGKKGEQREIDENGQKQKKKSALLATNLHEIEDVLNEDVLSFSNNNWDLETLKNIFASNIEMIKTRIVALQNHFNTELEMRIEILDNENKKIGEMIRTFTREIDDDGIERIKIDHEHFGLIPLYQDKGIASNLLNSNEEEYKKNGVYSINLEANLDVGGYAWALQGYDFANELNLRRMRNKFETAIRNNLANKKINEEQFNRLINEIRGFYHSWEFASWNPNKQPWGQHFGKRMMMGSSWHGEKVLNEYNLGYRIGKLYYESKKQ